MITKEQREEHEAWGNLFNEIAKAFGVSGTELNKEKYRDMFLAIERWGIAHANLVKEIPDANIPLFDKVLE